MTILLNDEDGRHRKNKLYKVQPVIDHVRANCRQIEPENEQSIDEQIIPAKTAYSGIKQYNPKKPKKWGFKNFVRSGSSGLMYDFFFYQGSSTAEGQKCTGAYAVLRLIETLPQNQNFKLFFDNWFCSLQLCLQLKSLGFQVTATIRADRVKGCPLPAEKDLKKKVGEHMLIKRMQILDLQSQNGSITSVFNWPQPVVILTRSMLSKDGAKLKKSMLKLIAQQLFKNTTKIWEGLTYPIC